MPIPKVYSQGGDIAVNYDYQDIVDGTGIISYFAADASGANVLTKVPMYSELGATRASGAVTKITSFALVFNRPRVLKGRTFLNCPLAVVNNTGTTTTASAATISWNVQKITGGAANAITSGAYSCRWPGSLAGVTYYDIMSVAFDVPRTHFKIGDFLVFSLTNPGTINAGGQKEEYIYIGHDPGDRKVSMGLSAIGIEAVEWPYTSQTILNLPFELVT